MVKNPGTDRMEIITKKGETIEKYTPSEEQENNGSRGRRVGTAYQLDSGEIIHVPEKPRKHSIQEGDRQLRSPSCSLSSSDLPMTPPTAQAAAGRLPRREAGKKQATHAIRGMRRCMVSGTRPVYPAISRIR